MALPLSSKIGIGVIVVAAAGLMFWSAPAEGVLEYVYVDQVTQDASRFAGRTFKVHGKVVEGTVQQKIGEAGDYTFEIVHNGAKLPVHYTNMVPDTFAEGGEVVLTGQLSAGGVFESEEMAAKCPSKYEEQEKANPDA